MAPSTHTDQRQRAALEFGARPSHWILAGCAVWLIGLGFYFILLRPPLLPEDVRYIGLFDETNQTVPPKLELWLDLVFTVMGGFIFATGVLLGYLCRTCLPAGLRGTTAVLFTAGIASVGCMSVVNFMIQSDFRWLLVLPTAAWIAGSALYASGR